MEPIRDPMKAVEWVRAVRDAQYEETKDMSMEEFLAYISRKATAVRAAAERAGRLGNTHRSSV